MTTEAGTASKPRDVWEWGREKRKIIKKIQSIQQNSGKERKKRRINRIKEKHRIIWQK